MRFSIATAFRDAARASAPAKFALAFDRKITILG
jgi:hypothetical protein